MEDFLVFVGLESANVTYVRPFSSFTNLKCSTELQHASRSFLAFLLNQNAGSPSTKLCSEGILEYDVQVDLLSTAFRLLPR